MMQEEQASPPDLYVGEASPVSGAGVVFNVLWLMLGVGIVAMSLRMQIIADSGVGGGFAPLLLGLILIASSISLLVKPVAIVPSEETQRPDRAGMLRIAAVVASMVAFPILMPFLGFFATALLVMLCLLPVIARRNIVMTAAIALASSGGIHFVFSTLLGLRLPRGPWGF